MNKEKQQSSQGIEEESKANAESYLNRLSTIREELANLKIESPFPDSPKMKQNNTWEEGANDTGGKQFYASERQNKTLNPALLQNEPEIQYRTDNSLPNYHATLNEIAQTSFEKKFFGQLEDKHKAKHKIAFEEQAPHNRNQSCEQLLYKSSSSFRSGGVGSDFVEDVANRVNKGKITDFKNPSAMLFPKITLPRQYPRQVSFSGKDASPYSEPEPDRSQGNISSNESFNQSQHPLSKRISKLSERIDEQKQAESKNIFRDSVQIEEFSEFQDQMQIIPLNIEDGTKKFQEPLPSPKQTLLERIENKVSVKLYKIVGIIICCLDVILALYIISGIVYYQAVSSDLHSSQDNSFKWQLFLTLIFEVLLAPFTFWFSCGGLFYHKRAHCCMLIIVKFLQAGMMLFSGIIELKTNQCSIDAAIRPFLNCRTDINIFLLVIRFFYDFIVLIVAFLGLTHANRLKRQKDELLKSKLRVEQQNTRLRIYQQNKLAMPGRVERTKLTNAFTASNGFVRLRSEMEQIHSRNQNRQLEQSSAQFETQFGSSTKLENAKAEELKVPNAYFKRDKQGKKTMTSATDVSNLRLMKSNAKKGAFRKLIKFGNVMG